MSFQKSRASADQLAKQEQRRLKKLQAVPPPIAVTSVTPNAQILERAWVDIKGSSDLGVTESKSRRGTLLLAQTLVRRSLFPASDCLKAGQRERMLYRELLEPRADILCLQEVDRLEKILPFVERAGYAHVYACGPKKKHGCLIAYDAQKFEIAGLDTVVYDNEDVRPAAGTTGSSFKTKNIGSIVALRSKEDQHHGYVVATTHLFWHPSYTYERARQAGILLREAAKFRDANEHGLWPCLLAGDFNFAPDDPAYALLVDAPLLPAHESALVASRVVHVSLDPTVPLSAPKAAATDGEGDGDGDEEGRASASSGMEIKNARLARVEDGLLTTPELIQLFRSVGTVRSAYDDGQRAYRAKSTCGARLGLPASRSGSHEPEWTSYTHYWKTVLDYIFILDPPDKAVEIVGYLQPPDTPGLAPGIPRKGVTQSDHVSLVAELHWPHGPANSTFQSGAS